MHSSSVRVGLQYWNWWPWQRDKVVVHCSNRLFRYHRFLDEMLQESHRRKVSFAVLILVFLLNIVSPKKPAIRCRGNETDDPTISHRHKGETISTAVVLSTVLIIPFVQMLVSEWFINKQPSNPYGFHPIETSRWKRTMFFAARWYRDYFCGFAFMVFLIEVAKTTVSAPRPHFVHSCNPHFHSDNCIMGWVEIYNCTNAHKLSNYKLNDAHKSFPSGHAALGFYSALFMIIYQQYRLNVKRLGVVTVCWLHLMWGTWAIFCALSRVTDFRHHPVDVIIGSVLGLAVAGFTAVTLCNKFRKELSLESYQNKIVSGLNGNAGILEGYSSSPSPPHLNPSLPSDSAIINNGKVPNRSGNANGDIKRPSLRRLLSQQSTLTTMSDIAEDRELDNL